MSNSNSKTKFCKRCQADTERYESGGCKPCCRASSAAYLAANPDKKKARMATYRAANQSKIKAYNAAYSAANSVKSKESTARWRAANPEKSKAMSAAWYLANIEKVREQGSAYRASNPEARRISVQNRLARKRSAGGTLSKGLAEKLFILQQGKCPCCKQPLGNDFHLDHIMPIALGGMNVDSNIQLLHQRCNNQKHAKHPIDFMQSRGNLI